MARALAWAMALAILACTAASGALAARKTLQFG
jgi:hypothetical protein